MKSDHLHSHHRILVIGSNVHAIQKCNHRQIFSKVMKKYLTHFMSLLSFYILWKHFAKSCSETFFAKFTEKHLRWSFFFNKIADSRLNADPINTGLKSRELLQQCSISCSGSDDCRISGYGLAVLFINI